MERTLGHILRVAMVDAGLNQRELADKVGLTLQTVNRHINNKTDVSVPQLVRYGEVLGVQFLVAPATGLEPVTYRSKDRAVA
jgi:plasmid maintenance system antidote protein VapI